MFVRMGLFKNLLNSGMAKLTHHLTIPGFGSPNSAPTGENSKIVFVLPISGRFAAFKRFLEIYESVAIQEDTNCDLLIVIFGNQTAVQDHLQMLNNFRRRNLYQQINYIHRIEEFSRGIALDIATRSSYIQENDIILFIDVDMIFRLETLQRIRLNTLQGKQVYLPIVFSQYDTKRTLPRHSNDVDEINNETGYFRQFGFGICAIYKSDILDEDINGFDKDITGWGLEDVRFLDKIVKIGNRQNSFLVNTAEVPAGYNEAAKHMRRLSIFRAPDPTLVHIYHDISCDMNLEAAQYNMCLGTKANSLGSTRLMEAIFYSNKENIDFILEFNRKKEVR